MNLYLLARLHGDCEWDGFESWDEVEGSFRWYGLEAFRCVCVDDKDALWLCDSDGFGIGLSYCFAGS